MNISFCSLASSSSGNSYLIKTDKEAVLVDVGISATRIAKNLRYAGVDSRQIKRIFLTHEHSDHVSGLSVLLKQIGHGDLKVCASEGTFKGLKDSIQNAIPESRRIYVEEDYIVLSEMRVKPFNLSHDARSPKGYSVSVNDGEGQISIATDTGVFTDEMYETIKESDVLVLESNYDEKSLIKGKYPMFLKERILSDVGHLSNEMSSKVALKIMNGREKRRCIFLGHLSKENNTPKLAFDAVNKTLMGAGYEPKKDYYLSILDREHMSREFVL